MTRTPLILCLVAAAALAGCEQEAVTVNTGLEDNVSTNDVVLPPSIAASKIYRCKDNSVIYIDWLSDNKSANVRTERNGPPTHVVAPAEGEAMVAEGFSLTGTGDGSSVTLTRPGKGGQTCRV